MSGRFFNGDMGCDSDDDCRELFWMHIIPNIKLLAALGAVGFHRPCRRMPNRRLLALAVYVGFALAVAVALPAGSDVPSAMPEAWEFRVMSALAVAAFWAFLGVISGQLWDRYAPAARLQDSFR